ncbi:MAG: M1 family aminopeptidase [Terriglobales bacterium]
MGLARPLLRRAAVLAGALLLLATSSFAAEKQRIRVDDYDITAELLPRAHKLTARAQVRFTALDDISVATFELHNALRVTKVEDADGHPLIAERVTQDSTVRVPLSTGVAKGATATLIFSYEGVLQSSDDSPVEGLKLAYVGDPESYLLYAGRWFPMVGYGTNRFTAAMHITVPSSLMLVGSGKQTTSLATVQATEPPEEQTVIRNGKRVKVEKPRPPKSAQAAGKITYTFTWDKPSFPGTILAGQFYVTDTNRGGINVQTYMLPNKRPLAESYGETAAKEFEYFTSLYGRGPSTTLKVVELPDDTVPSAWAPELAVVAARAINEKVNYRLLANTIAHQWWGALVSPANRESFWLSDGFARYSEARYVEQAAGESGFEEVTRDMSVGALAYDTVPLGSSGKLDIFSPEFQSLATNKGGMILHMLRWVIGDAAFDQTMRAFATQFAWKPANSDDFRQVAEAQSGQRLTGFFTQWLDSTGAPDFKNKYTVYRLGNNKGFRIAGEIQQDLDLFRMPIDVKVDTDGKTEFKRIEVVGTDSPYVIETFGRPRRIVLDPDNHVLKNSADLKTRASILRGQQLVQQGDYSEALKEFNKALDENHNSSLAAYRIAEVFFLQHNYQAAADYYRRAMNGDGEPKWTEVWSYLQLGKIFDITDQRDRAVNMYRQALQTHDDTQGALEEARKYLQTPYKREVAKDSSGM